MAKRGEGKRTKDTATVGPAVTYIQEVYERVVRRAELLTLLGIPANARDVSIEADDATSVEAITVRYSIHTVK